MKSNMKTNKMLRFGILVAVLVITDCITGKEPVDFWIFMAALAVTGSIAKREPERFQKLMANTLVYVMYIGLVLSFIEILSLCGIEILNMTWSFSPLNVMSAISCLFFFAYISEKWTLPTRQDTAKKESGIMKKMQR